MSTVRATFTLLPKGKAGSPRMAWLLKDLLIGAQRMLLRNIAFGWLRVNVSRCEGGYFEAKHPPRTDFIEVYLRVTIQTPQTTFPGRIPESCTIVLSLALEVDCLTELEGMSEAQR